MDFFEAVAERRSIRRYLHREIEEEKVAAILSCANAAPSAGNLQAYEIVVVRDPERRRAIAAAALSQGFLAEAPLVLVFLINPSRSAAKYGARGMQLYAIQDAAIACAYAQLAATSLGLASCWVGAFHVERIARLVEAPPDVIPVALLAVGYAGEHSYATPRRSLSDLVHQETF